MSREARRSLHVFAGFGEGDGLDELLRIAVVALSQPVSNAVAAHWALPANSRSFASLRMTNLMLLLDDSTFLFRPILDRDHELQSRPDLGDGADFHVHQAGIKPALANHIFREVSGNA